MDSKIDGGINSALRKIFETSGYRRYKMSKFEEYDLYAGNKNFLASDSVLTFTDTDGKLMALKPDVTLSIIKNYNRSSGLEKVYYHENVYRDAGMGFREIEQAGLECIGEVDEYSVCEVLGLAAECLKRISGSCELDISHFGILCEVLENVPEDDRKLALDYIGGKNFGELETLLRRGNVPDDAARRIIDLASLDCPAENASEKLTEILGGFISWERLQLFSDTCDFLGEEYPGEVRVDFSTVGDIGYYSGIIFQGYISGIPQAVLSGGQYDGLMKRLKKPSRAIGFAVYLDMLEPLFVNTDKYDFDALVIYTDEYPPKQVFEQVKMLKKDGKRVLAAREIPENLKIKDVYKMSRGGAVKVD